MQPRRETTPFAPLSTEDASLGRLRWIVALALTGLIVVGAALQLGITKLRASDQPQQPSTPASAPNH